MLAFAPLDGAIGAGYTAVLHLASALTPMGGAAAAIVVFTLAVRLLLLPLSVAAVRGERRRKALFPQIQELQRRHDKDQARLQKELAELYRREGASPFAGCLPMLLQAPFFIVAYPLFTSPTIAGHPNALLDHHLFGAVLGLRLTATPASASPIAVWAVLIAILVGLAWWFSRRAGRAPAMNPTAGTGGSPAGGWIAALPRILPYGTVLAAAFVPLAAMLYLTTTTTWTAAEQLLLRR